MQNHRMKPGRHSPKRTRSAPTEPPERIQKLFARAGLGSRREVEQWIRAGEIRVNGAVATLGDRISMHDQVQLRGRPVKLAAKIDSATRVLIYHKPVGEIVSRRDPEGRPTVFKKLPRLPNGRWIAIGRLDINTQGLLMLTNQGELAHRLMHPSHMIDREYAVRVKGAVTPEMLERLVTGVELEDGRARFEDIQSTGGEGANQWFHVVVAEGRNRLVRRLWESQDCQVSRLIRVRYGPVALPAGLPAGRSVELEQDAVTDLMKLVELNA